MHTRTTTKLALIALTATAAGYLGEPRQAIAQAIKTIPPVLDRAAAPATSARTNPNLHLVAKSKRAQSIVVLVNDDPITNWEISKRQALLGMNAKGISKRAQSKFKQLLKSETTTAKLKAMIKKIIAENPGKPREEVIAIIEKRKKRYAKKLQARAVSSARASVLPGLRKKATEELIDERLQIQEAKRLNVLVSDSDLDGVIGTLAKRNKMTAAQFANHLKSAGSNITTMKSRFRAMLSWRNVIRSRFGQEISVKTGDIDRLVTKAANDTAESSEFKLQRITLPVVSGANPAILAERIQSAELIRASFSDCNSTGALANQFGGARLENLGDKSAASLKEPARSMIQNARDGEMLPPLIDKTGVTLWIVCGRKAVSAKTAQREEATQSLRQREFNVMGQRHMKDLRQDAHIEYR